MKQALKKLNWLSAQPGMDEPLVRWGLLLSAIIVLWSLAFVPYMDWREVQLAQAEVKARKVLKLEALKSSSSVWKQAQLDYQKEMDALSRVMFQGSSYASAQASLLKSVTTLLRSHHLKIDSQRLIDAEVDDVFGQKVAIYLRVSGKQFDVMRFMYAIARTDKLIVLETLYIDQLGRNQSMMLQFQASGFRMGGINDS